jgi:hypothetical protein
MFRRLLLALVVALICAPGALAVDEDGNPVVAAVGDMVCASTFRDLTHCHHAEVASRIASDPTIDRVLALGDLQYECGSNVAGKGGFPTYYDPTFGVFKLKTYPTPRNHEHYTSTSSRPKRQHGEGGRLLLVLERWDAEQPRLQRLLDRVHGRLPSRNGLLQRQSRDVAHHHR